MVVALNMSDLARRRGIHIDVAALERELGMPVVETVGVRHEGARALVENNWIRYVPTAASRAQGMDRADPGRRDRRPSRRCAASCAAAVNEPHVDTRLDDRIDAVVLHPVWGLPMLAVLLFLMFQAVFSWAQCADGCDQGGRAGTRRTGAVRLPRACCAACWWTA